MKSFFRRLRRQVTLAFWQTPLREGLWDKIFEKTVSQLQKSVSQPPGGSAATKHWPALVTPGPTTDNSPPFKHLTIESNTWWRAVNVCKKWGLQPPYQTPVWLPLPTSGESFTSQSFRTLPTPPKRPLKTPTIWPGGIRKMCKQPKIMDFKQSAANVHTIYSS